ncbi:MAG: DUF1559 domain-containing protein [Gemmataceae bacterium]|nr:DUF1559 domain-containing protein [Gemmataceae bacterium]
MFRLFCSTAIALFLAQSGQSAPGPKESDKPEAPATPAQRQRAVNNLKMIGIAMHNYHDTTGALPANTVTKDGKAGLSWRVLILPYLEEDTLYRQFKLDEAWDRENNIKLVDKLPKVFAPVRGKAEKNQTFYQMFAGKVTLLGEGGKGITFNNVTDGLSNTIMVVEGGKPVDWTKPGDLEFDGKTVPKLGGMFDGQFNALMGDGSVKKIPKGIDQKVLLDSITRDGGEVADLDEAIKKAKE